MEFPMLPCVVESYVESLNVSNVEDIGKKEWFEFHKKLMLLNQQSAHEIISYKEEYVKELFTSLKKITVLIHEAIQIDIWKNKVFPVLLDISEECTNTIILFSILYHENVVISLLENVLFHSESMATIGDSIIDLVDYAVKYVTTLLQSNDIEPYANVKLEKVCFNEILDKKRELEFDIGIRCISIIRYVIEFLDDLPLCVFSRILIAHDTPLLLVQLIEMKPWLKSNIKGEKLIYEGKWKNLDDEIKMCKIEGQVWFGLRQLLLNPKFVTYYKITDFSLRQFLKLQKYLHDDTLDQIAPLIDLKRWLNYISFNAASRSDVSYVGVNVEIIPQIRSSILNKYHKKWHKLARYQVKRIFPTDLTYIKNIAGILKDAYNFNDLHDMEHKKCSMCEKNAEYRCANCKKTWYCNRECQIKHWKYHKKHCSEVTNTN